jgi:hypothetical protein
MFSNGWTLAPQVGFEPTTLRLTADTVLAASHCKHNYLDARRRDFPENAGGLWGIDAADGAHLWSERYDREMSDIFTLLALR